MNTFAPPYLERKKECGSLRLDSASSRAMRLTLFQVNRLLIVIAPCPGRDNLTSWVLRSGGWGSARDSSYRTIAAAPRTSARPLAGRRLGLEAVRSFRADFAPLIEVVWVDEALHEAGLDLLRERRKRRLSLVDAVSFVTMRQRGVAEAFAFDPQ